MRVFYDTKGRRRKIRDIYKKMHALCLTGCLPSAQLMVNFIYATNNVTLWEEPYRVYCSVPTDDRDKREF